MAAQLLVNDPLLKQDVIDFIQKVKKRFSNDEKKYLTFLDRFRDYQNEKTNTQKLLQEKMLRVFLLLRGEPDLLEEFNCFLPDGTSMAETERKISTIDLSKQLSYEDASIDLSKQLSYEDAINFVVKVQRRFYNDEQKYKFRTFVDLLNGYQGKNMSIHKIQQEVSLIFGDEPDLIQEFNRFLPEDAISMPETSEMKHPTMEPKTKSSP